MVNFGLLTAEIVSLVWGTPANFNGFLVLAALLYGTLVVGVNQTAAFNRGRHLYSAGRPSGWALAHISSSFFFGLFVTRTCCIGETILTIYTSLWRLSACFFGISLICLPIQGVKSPKNNFLGVSRHFHPKLAKSKNMHIIKTTALIPTKFCTTTKTTKCSSRVVQTRA